MPRRAKFTAQQRSHGTIAPPRGGTRQRQTRRKAGTQSLEATASAHRCARAMPVGLPNVPQGVSLRTSRSRWTSVRVTLSASFATVAIATSGCQQPTAPVGTEALAPDTTLDLAALPSDAIPNRYIVVFKSSAQDSPGLARQLVKQHGGRLRHAYATALKGFAAEL